MGAAVAVGSFPACCRKGDVYVDIKAERTGIGCCRPNAKVEAGDHGSTCHDRRVPCDIEGKRHVESGSYAAQGERAACHIGVAVGM